MELSVLNQKLKGIFNARIGYVAIGLLHSF